MESEKELEKAAIEYFETHGLMVLKVPKFYDRLHRPRNVDLGCPDLFIFHKGKAFGIEMKTAIGRLSDEQKAFRARFERTQCAYFVCRSIDDCQAISMAVKAL